MNDINNTAAKTDVSALNIPQILDICKEMESWHVQHAVVINTSLTYPDLRYIWRILLHVAGVKECMHPDASKTVSELLLILKQKKTQSAIYRCSGLSMLDLNTVIEALSCYSSAFDLDKWYEITHLLLKTNGLLFDSFLPYKECIRFGWRCERIVSNDLCGKTLDGKFSGYVAVALWMVVSVKEYPEKKDILDKIDNILNNDLTNHNICLGSRLSDNSVKMILDGFDPLSIIEPMVLNEAQWKEFLLPALNKFERYMLY